MFEICDDPRHEAFLELARQLNQRVFAQEAPENIYDWLSGSLGKFRPPDNSNAIMDWKASFELYDAEIARRIALAQLPESERKQFDWPWHSWNTLIDPIEAGILVLLAGPDGSGKTTFAECIAEYWARRGQKVVFVHFELSKIIMLDRRAARHTAIARRQLKLAGELTTKDLADIERHKAELLKWPGEVTYLHTPGKSMELVIRELVALKDAGQCDVAIFDYLEKAAPSAAQLKAFGSNHFQREANDVELVKTFSESHGVPALMLSQFNKAGKQSSFGDLSRSDIRGAGEKTEKANVVVLLQPDKTVPGVINVKLDKNTLGPHGTFSQWFDGPRFQVADMVKQQL